MAKISIDDIRRTDGSFSNFIAEGFYRTSLKNLTELVKNYQAELTPEERKRIFEEPFVGPGNISYQFSVDKNNNVSLKEVNLEMDNLRNSRKRVGQQLEISQDRRTVSQSISLEKAGMSTPQTFSVTTHNENLLSVTQDGKMVASFQEKDGSIQMTASKEFVENFFSKYENLDLGAKEEDGENYVFDMANLKLTKSGNLEAGEVRANSTAFAIMFSALGSQIRDAAGNRAMQANSNLPFDITVSTNFIKNAVQEKNGCTMEMEEPIFSALMISRIHLARETFKSGKTEPVHLDLQREFGSREEIDPAKNIILHSVPFFREGQDEKNPEYLNIMQRGGKSFLYVQTRDAQNRLTAPQFYEIRNVALQVDEATHTEGLYFGLGGTKTTDILLKIDRSTNTKSATNNSSLEDLSKILTTEISRTADIQEQKTSSKSRQNLHGLPVHPVSTSEQGAEIVSFGNVRQLERTPNNQTVSNQNLFHVENPENPDNPDGNGEPAPSPINPNPEQTEQQNIVEQQTRAQENEPQPAPAQENEPQQQQQAPAKEKKKKKERRAKKPPKEWKDLAVKDPNHDYTKAFAALFALDFLVMIMIPLPVFTFIIPAILGMSVILNEFVHPISTTKKVVNWAHHLRDRDPDKEKLKELNKEINKFNKAEHQKAEAEKVERKQQKAEAKNQKAAAKMQKPPKKTKAEKIQDEISKVQKKRQQRIESLKALGVDYRDGMTLKEVYDAVNAKFSGPGSYYKNLNAKIQAKNTFELIKEYDSDIYNFEIAKAQATLPSQQKALKDANKELSQAKKDTKKAEKPLDNVNESIDSVDQEIKATKNRIEEIRIARQSGVYNLKKLNEAKNDVKTAEKDVKSAEKEVLEAQENLSKNETEQQVFEEQAKNRTDMVKDLDNQIKRQEQAIKKKKKFIMTEKETAELEAMQQKLDQTKQQRADVQKDLDGVNKHLGKLREQHSTQIDVIRQKNANLTVVNKKLTDAKKVLADQQKYNDIFEESLRPGNGVEDLSKKITELEKTREKLESSSGELEENLVKKQEAEDAATLNQQTRETELELNKSAAKTKKQKTKSKKTRKKMEQLEEFKLEDEPAPTNAAPDASKEERRAKKQRAKGREKDAGRSMRA